MHDAQFAAAARPARCVILGLPMLPYSIGHEITLVAKCNALVFSDSDKVPEYELRTALIQAADICSQGWHEYEDNSLSIASNPHWYQLRLLIKKIRFLKAWGKWMKVVERFNFEDEKAKFIEYRKIGSDFPPIPTDEHYKMANGEEFGENSRSYGSSYFARLINFIGGLGLHRVFGAATPWDMPFALSNQLYISHLESNGRAAIENEKEMTVRKEMEEHYEAIRKETEIEEQKAREAAKETSCQA
jgi:hypothetical protein